MSTKTINPILHTRLPFEGIDFPAEINKVRKDYGIGAYKQIWQIFTQMLGRNRRHPSEYYQMGLFRPELSREEKKTYVSRIFSAQLNSRLSPKDLRNQKALLDNKLLTGRLLSAFGFPSPKDKAVFAPMTQQASLLVLTNRQDVSAFIKNPINLPLFAKPIHGSRGLGAVSILSGTPVGTHVILGDGREVAADDLAREMVAFSPEGYIFQELLIHDATMLKRFGPAISTIRIATLLTSKGTRIPYAVLRMAGRNAMLDNNTIAGNALGLVDISTGEVTQIQIGHHNFGEAITHSKVTGEQVVGKTVPRWQDVKDLACTAHELFPDHGILGWDIAITEQGPVIVEVNESPINTIYQGAARRGLLNPDLRPLFEDALGLAKRKQVATKARLKNLRTGVLMRRV